MLDLDKVPPVAADELLARYILFAKHVRADHTVRPEAFMPHPHAELSMTRHIQASPDELWKDGERVAGLCKLKLHGRADVSVTDFTAQGLEVVSAPLPENPNHCNATNWPPEKPEQKIKALLIAQKSEFVPKPD